MDKDWTRDLVARFPEFFQVDDGDNTPYALFGIECDDGWQGLITEFCRDTRWILEQKGLPLSTVRVEQIKEKFGGLRIYARVGGVPDVFDVIDHYEKLSYRFCERCGLHGTLRTHRPWYKTLCDACDKQEDERVAQRVEAFKKRVAELNIPVEKE